MKARTLPSAAVLAAGLALVGAAPALADSCAGMGAGPVLTVKVTGVRVARGEMAVTIYPDNPKRWLAPHAKLLRQRVKTAAPVTTACFNLPKAGVYAVAVYHDADGDRDFNRNALGMPTEGFAFSNDAPTRFGVPAFDAVRFTVKDDLTISTAMRYPK